MSVNKEEFIIFEENRRLQGWNVNVLDDWGMKTKQRFVSNHEKELFLQEFGEKIITEKDFMDWWCRINNYC